jgi:hypothetical protein
VCGWEGAGSGPSRCGVGVGSVRAGVDCRDGLSAARRRHVLVSKRSHLGIVCFGEFSDLNMYKGRCRTMAVVRPDARPKSLVSAVYLGKTAWDDRQGIFTAGSGECACHLLRSCRPVMMIIVTMRRPQADRRSSQVEQRIQCRPLFGQCRG